MSNRLTKFNLETGRYEYIEPAKTQGEFVAQRKAVIQRLGELEDKASKVAEEIFAEISKASADWGCYCISAFKWGYVTSDVSRTLAELKKKYTESEKDNGKM